jgi:DNA polymerase III delta subunit
MEIIILQGEDNLALAKRLDKFIAEAKLRNWSIVRITKDEPVLEKIFLSSGLYASKSLFIIDDYKFLSKKDIKKLGEKLEKIDGVLVICSQGGPISSSFLKGFPKIKKIENFNYPKITYQFLDSLYPKNSKNALFLLHQLQEKQPSELIFHMIATRFRDLYWAKKEPSTLPFSSWQVEKLERQSARFTEEKLKNFIEDLALIDVEAKRSSLGIVYYLDLLIAKHLK